MSDDCIFCKIVAGEISSQTVFHNDDVFCFRDTNPQAPTHVLLVPRVHITDASTVNEYNAQVIGAIVLAAQIVAHQEQLENGWRLVANVGDDAGNSVAHLHFHLLGGRRLQWPPG